MTKKKVKRCVRPQCMKVYEETEKNRFCICGATLQAVEMEIKPKGNTCKKPVSPSKPKVNPAFLYLLLEDDDVKFELYNITRIGRSADGVQADIDLAEYVGKNVSREHAVIRKERDGYYITNVSRNHSVRVIDSENNEVALEYGSRVLLKSEDGILLSRKVLLQFVEE